MGVKTINWKHWLHRWLPLLFLIPISYLLKPILWTPIDYRFYNYFHSKRQAPSWNEVVVIAIDRNTVDNTWDAPVYPFSRHIETHARLTDRLAAAGARAIIFDLRLTEDLIGSDPVVLADAFRSAGNVFLAMTMKEEHLTTETGEEITGYSGILPHDSLLAASNGAYVVDVKVDSDGRLRRYVPDARLKELDLERLSERLTNVPVRRSFPIEFPSLENPMPVVSYGEILHGDDDALSLVRGRIAFVGSFVDESADFIPVPRLQVYPDGHRARLLPGVVVLATITENLLEGMPMRDAGWFVGLIWNVMWCLLAVSVMPRKYPALSATIFVSVTAISLVATGISHIVVGLVFPAGLLLGSMFICGLHTLIMLDRQTTKELYAEEAEHDRVRKEIETARRTQKAILPSSIPEITGFDIWGDNVSSREVSGDYYDIVELENNKSVVIAIGDVSGKGLPASLLVSNVQAGLHSQLFQEYFEVDKATRYLNRLICDNTEIEAFVTFFVAELILEKRQLKYVRAGHEMPLLISKDGALRNLEEGGVILGLAPDVEYETAEISLSSGDVLCLYTDGVTEARNTSDEEFGIDRLVEIVRKSREQSAREIGEKIIKNTEEFTRLTRQEDDITLVILKVI